MKMRDKKSRPPEICKECGMPPSPLFGLIVGGDLDGLCFTCACIRTGTIMDYRDDLSRHLDKLAE